MYCSNCATKIEERAVFCQNCGDEAGMSGQEAGILKSAHSEKSESLEGLLYYSEEWLRAKYFAVSSLPYLDILVTKDNFYLIQFPKTHGGTLGLFLGLLLFNILGAVIGVAIGNSSDQKKRQKQRIAWFMDNKLISPNYKDYAFVKISKDKLGDHLSFEKNKFIVITDREKIIKLKKNKKEFTQFNKFIKSYVL
ncbi:zinc ribbon domain-containing protein [Candidatus Parcubacteria bacterium]|nr:zinc ribbon domain-containing protein [Candidatus Parcubacteria bacterium]